MEIALFSVVLFFLPHEARALWNHPADTSLLPSLQMPSPSPRRRKSGPHECNIGWCLPLSAAQPSPVVSLCRRNGEELERLGKRKGYLRKRMFGVTRRAVWRWLELCAAALAKSKVHAESLFVCLLFLLFFSPRYFFHIDPRHFLLSTRSVWLARLSYSWVLPNVNRKMPLGSSCILVLWKCLVEANRTFPFSLSLFFSQFFSISFCLSRFLCFFSNSFYAGFIRLFHWVRIMPSRVKAIVIAT